MPCHKFTTGYFIIYSKGMHVNWPNNLNDTVYVFKIQIFWEGHKYLAQIFVGFSEYLNFIRSDYAFTSYIFHFLPQNENVWIFHQIDISVVYDILPNNFFQQKKLVCKTLKDFPEKRKWKKSHSWVRYTEWLEGFDVSCSK